MEIKRNKYLEKLIKQRKNGFIKILTGLRRVGKSYILNKLFYEYLLETGLNKENIIQIELDRLENKALRNPDSLYSYILSKIDERKEFVIMIDEVQLVDGFEDVLNSLLHYSNVDVYITGSNSRFLSSDILTTFRGRSREIHILPLSWEEFVRFKVNQDFSVLWTEYYTYGGMPQVVLANSKSEKEEILNSLYNLVYLTDIVERNKITKLESLRELVTLLASQTGSLTNTLKISNTFLSVKKEKIDNLTVIKYIHALEMAFLVNAVPRYDIKGRKIIGALRKYYFEDTGLRNITLSFSQLEINHIMESIVYNELRYRGYSVQIGIVEQNYSDQMDRRRKRQLEIDFIARKNDFTCYIQVTLSLKDAEKRKLEERPFLLINDNYKKIIVTEEYIVPHYDEDGIFFTSIRDFLEDAF